MVNNNSRKLTFLLCILFFLNACVPLTPAVESIVPVKASTTIAATATFVPKDEGFEPITIDNLERVEQVGLLGTGLIYDVIASPDQTKIAVYVNDQIRVYDAQTLVELQVIETGRYLTNTYKLEAWHVLSFSPDGQILAYYTGYGLALWDFAKSESLYWRGFLVPDWDIVNIEFSPSGENIMITTLGSSGKCDLGMNFALYDIEGRLLFDQYDCAFYTNNYNGFTRDGKAYFVFSSIMTDKFPSRFYLVDTKTGHVIESSEYDFSADPTVPQKVLYAVSPDGGTLAYIVYNGDTVKTQLVDFQTRSLLQTVDGYVEFFVDNGRTAWQTRQSLKEQPKKIALEDCIIENDHMADHYHLLFSSAEQAVLSLSHFGHIQNVELWDLKSCKVKKTLSYPSATEIIFSPDGRWLAASNGFHAYLWDLKTGKLHLSFHGKPFTTPNDIIQFSKDGTRFLVSSFGREYIGPGQPYRNYIISVYDTYSGKLIHEIQPRSEFLNAILASPDDEIILVDDSAGLHFWDIETGKLLSTLPSGAYVFDPVRHQIWIAPEQNTRDMTTCEINLYNYRTGEKIRKLATVRTAWVRNLYLDKDSKKIMAHLFLGQGKDLGEAIKIFDTANGYALLDFRLPWRSNYWSEVYGDIYATGLNDATINLWDYENDTPYLTLKGEKIYRKVNDNYSEENDFGFGIRDTVFLSEEILITRHDKIRFWDTRSGDFLLEMMPNYEVENISCSPDGSLIAVVGEDGLIRLWGITVH